MADHSVEIPTPQGDYIQHAPRSLPNRAALEFCGMFAFVYISLAGVSQAVLSEQSQLHVAICFALGLTGGIIIASPSGAHLNPAVSTVVYMTDDKFGLADLASYIAAQMLGGIAAGLLVLAVYSSWIQDIDDSMLIGTFGTIKNSNINLTQSIIDQFIGSALLMFGIALTPASWTQPLTIGAVLGGLGLFQGVNGFAFNPARDLGPRIASMIVFGDLPFTAESYWFWVPMVVPFFGTAFGWLVSIGVKHLRE